MGESLHLVGGREVFTEGKGKAMENALEMARIDWTKARKFTERQDKAEVVVLRDKLGRRANGAMRKWGKRLSDKDRKLLLDDK